MQAHGRDKKSFLKIPQIFQSYGYYIIRTDLIRIMVRLKYYRMVYEN